MDYQDLVPYKQLRDFFKMAYDFDLNLRQDIKQNIVDKYIEESRKNQKNAERILKQRVNNYFEADDLDVKIIQRKIDRIIKEI